jgi:hypothetical protein
MGINIPEPEELPLEPKGEGLFMAVVAGRIEGWVKGL